MRLPPPNKILIIRLSSIGDILLTSPVMWQLRERYPLAQIDFLTRTEFSSLLATNPHLNNVLTLDTNLGKVELEAMRSQIQAAGYDIILDLHVNIRSLFLTRLKGSSPIMRMKKDKFARFALVKMGIDLYARLYGRSRTVAEKYLLAGEALGLDSNEQRLELWLPPEIESAEEERWKTLSSKGFHVAMAPGARHFTKRWPEKKYAELITKLYEQQGWRTILLGGPDERTLSESIIAQLKDYSIIENLVGQLSLIESCALIKQAGLFVSNDSGLMHAAACFGIPQLAIFGSTTLQLGFGPINDRAAILENSDLGCRPCSHIGKSICPKGHFKCMNELTSDMALHSLTNLSIDGKA
ncbi:MAG: lipopolysaccharide heptosyltransferase II [Calditrichia bacterium]